MSLQNILIRQRIWLLVACCMLGLLAIGGVAIVKAQQQFMNMKREQYASLTTVALKTIDFFYQASRRGEMTDLQARQQARAALKHIALDDRTYFYLLHTDELLIGHPFVTSIYPADTPEQLAASIRTNRASKIAAAERLGLPELLDAMRIVKEQLPGNYTGFFDYWFYQHPEDNTAITLRPDDENVPAIAEAKTAYAAHFEPWNWVVVSGIYRADLQALFASWLWGLSALFSVVLGALGLLAWRITRSVTRPLETTVLLMEDISAGTGDLSRRLDVPGNNELVQFAAGFNVFAEKIADIVRRVLRTNEELVAHSEHLKEVMGGTVTRSDAQLAETEMLASATTELSYSLGSVAERAQNSSQAALSAQQATESSQEAMRRNIQSIHSLTAALSSTQTEVQSMQSFSNDVSSVLEVIVSIAEQTNLLALNAAIEAARAGEQGRGFAVVADEVRTLAQRTQKSTAEIRQIVENLQSGTQRVVTAMQQGLDNSYVCVETAGASNDELNQVIRFVEEIGQMNADIAAAVEQQSATTHEIAASSNKIAENARLILKDTETNRSDLVAMDQQLKAMEDLVRGFRVQGTAALS